MTQQRSFIDIVNQYLQSDKLSLPVFNTAALQIQEELAKQEPEIKVVERIITTEQALSSQVLKIANSAFYRGLAEVTTIRAAIMRLGMKEIQQIVLMASTQPHFKSGDKVINGVMKKLWQHSVGCAYGSLWLSKRQDYGVEQSEAFFAGLFHDVGKLFILMVIEHIRRRNKTLKITNALLMEAMDKLHPLQGYRLLNHWNVPDPFCVVARDHHLDDFDVNNPMLMLVRMANMTCHKLGIGLVHDTSIQPAATLEANQLNLSEIDLAELEIMLEDAKVLAG